MSRGRPVIDGLAPGWPGVVALMLSVSRGQLGRLVEAGQEIGRIEIVDVYSGGSRTRILGELSGPITASSVVEVFDPTE